MDKPDYILNMKQICAVIGVSRHTIYRLVKAGQFPPPAKIGLRQIGWKTSTIDRWLDERFRAAVKGKEREAES